MFGRELRSPFLFFLLLVVIEAGKHSKKPKYEEEPVEELVEDSIEQVTEKKVVDSIEDVSSKKIKRQGISMSGALRKKFAVAVALSRQRQSVVCSPLSALMPLGKIALGATGTTLTELLKAIGASETAKVGPRFKEIINALKHLAGVTLNIASQIYIRNDVELKSEFEMQVRDIFTVSLEKMSFDRPEAAARRINQWIETETQRKIRDVIKPDQIKASNLIIVNAVYFTGLWQSAFERVVIMPFTSPSGIQNIPMMIREDTYNYGASQTLDCTLLEIPYKESHASFVIVLPNSKDGLSVLLHALKVAPDLLDKTMKQMTKKRVRVTIPKFKVEAELDLSEIYRKIGVKQMFEANSGLTEIMDDGDTRVGTAIQKAMIEVTESGTTASAASGMVGLGSVGRQKDGPPVLFLADHPYFFMVRVEREMLFTGTYVEP